MSNEVPIGERCFRGCGRRADVVDGVSRYCARCYLPLLVRTAALAAGARRG